jgi:hypothetical protein
VLHILYSDPHASHFDAVALAVNLGQLLPQFLAQEPLQVLKKANNIRSTATAAKKNQGLLICSGIQAC